MKITYDSEANAIMIYLKDGYIQAAHSREIVPARMIVRFDENQYPLRIELLDVSEYIEDPTNANVIDLVQEAIAAGKR